MGSRPRGSGEEVEVSTVGDEPTTDRRVRFDFEVDFSNGGALQGQGFRLDIEGEDISEEQLARYVVEDMRLLMVEEVRILDKEIIAERHKRLEPS
jgi:arylformamidase